MDASSIRVLVADDYESWHHFFRSTLQKQPRLQIIGEASDGLETVQKAEELQPDLILLDIGLPSLNGIEAARRIREVSPTSKILFVSENRSPDIVAEALNTGAGGYVVKSDAGSDILLAIENVLRGKRFVSASLSGHDLVQPTEDQTDNLQPKQTVTPLHAKKKIRHEVQFYEDDTGFVDGFARFIEAALGQGNAVIVVATESHQASLLQRLAADGFSMPAEIEQGNLIALEVTRTLSSFMVNDSPDPVLFRRAAGNLILKAARQATGEPRRVAGCGECVHSLLAAGNLDATIALERLWSEMAELYDIDVLCGYFRRDFAAQKDTSAIERICAEHTATLG